MKKNITKITHIINQLFIIVLDRIFCLCPLNENKVLFLSDVRDHVGEENMGYIYNYLPEKYIKVTSFIKDRRIKRTLKEKIKLIYNLATSKYIILDDFSNNTSYIKIRKNQELVQLWHGAGAFKKVGYSRKINNGDLKDSQINPSYKKYTKVIVTSEDIRPCYAEAFSVDINKVEATGFPRTDLFFDKKLIEEKKSKLYKKYPFIKNKKVILFAPTYRGTKVRDAYYDFSKLDLDKIYKEFNKEYVFLFKWHPALYNNISNGKVANIDYSKYKDFYYDLSNERDINDLLLVSDILITDYSSVIFDWYFLNKPVIYFTYDLKDYKNGRGLYFPFEEYIYGLISNNTEELIEAIKEEDLCQNKRKSFEKKFLSSCDGNSTKKTYEFIFGGNNEHTN